MSICVGNVVVSIGCYLHSFIPFLASVDDCIVSIKAGMFLSFI